MVDADALRVAMQDAVKAADRCRRWCSHGAELIEGGYRIHHNGAGADTADQIVTAKGVLAWSPEVLTGRLTEWIKALHDPRRQGPPPDFNDYAEA